MNDTHQLVRCRGFYERFIKRLLDIFFAILVIVFFSWLYVIIAVLVRIKLGSPVIFKQPRPGLVNEKSGRERIFYIYKFRTMTNQRGANDVLLPDEVRLTRFGKKLRATSLDELPEVFNVLKGDMSIIGPRPQLVRDMVFMSERQRLRHTARPGLSGLAQVMGRNAISWDEKFEWDLIYIEDINLINDLKILCWTIKKVLIHGESSEELDITLDYGDALMKDGKISKAKYDALQAEAKEIISKKDNRWKKQLHY